MIHKFEIELTLGESANTIDASRIEGLLNEDLSIAIPRHFRSVKAREIAAGDRTIALRGNLSDGFQAIGPYDSFDEAAEAHEGDESWIVTLYAPDPPREEANDG